MIAIEIGGCQKIVSRSFHDPELQLRWRVVVERVIRPVICCFARGDQSLSNPRNTPLVLIVLDGFGYSSQSHGNAIALARTPHFDHWYTNYPNTLIEASGNYVGLAAGQARELRRAGADFRPDRLVVERLNQLLFLLLARVIAVDRIGRRRLRRPHRRRLRSDGETQKQRRGESAG